MKIVKTLGKVLVALTLFAAAGLSYAAPVNINTADVQALAENINGIGPKKAQAIIDYRQENGPFKTVEDLVKVKGIGLKIIERNKADLRVSDTVAQKDQTAQKPAKSN